MELICIGNAQYSLVLLPSGTLVVRGSCHTVTGGSSTYRSILFLRIMVKSISETGIALSAMTIPPS